MNQSLSEVSNLQVKALLFKHYQLVLGREHSVLDFEQVSYSLDDSSLGVYMICTGEVYGFILVDYSNDPELKSTRNSKE